MEECGHVWNAISYLTEIQKHGCNILFDVKYDNKNKPEAICWKLPEQHDGLIKFGDILFLDAQKRDMNKPGWPYIAPVVKDSELQVRTVCECLCISESIEIYQWILNTLTVMEPKFHIEHVCLIFADQLVTKTLLTNLNI